MFFLLSSLFSFQMTVVEVGQSKNSKNVQIFDDGLNPADVSLVNVL